MFSWNIQALILLDVDHHCCLLPRQRQAAASFPGGVEALTCCPSGEVALVQGVVSQEFTGIATQEDLGDGDGSCVLDVPSIRMITWCCGADLLPRKSISFPGSEDSSNFLDQIFAFLCNHLTASHLCGSRVGFFKLDADLPYGYALKFHCRRRKRKTARRRKEKKN